jgi:hypothetical protein
MARAHVSAVGAKRARDDVDDGDEDEEEEEPVFVRRVAPRRAANSTPAQSSEDQWSLGGMAVRAVAVTVLAAPVLYAAGVYYAARGAFWVAGTAFNAVFRSGSTEGAEVSGLRWPEDVTNARAPGGKRWHDVMQAALDGSNSRSGAGLLSGLWSWSADGRPLRLRVHSVLRVRHAAARRAYDASRDVLAASNTLLPAGRVDHVSHPMAHCLPRELLRDLRRDVNETYLWHGTEPGNVTSICQSGFNERLGNMDGLLGAGNYFADDSAKSDLYTTKDKDGLRYVLFSRVCLGHPCVLRPGEQQQERRELPCVRHGRLGRRFDSLIGTPRGADEAKEYVVYDGKRAFPEFIVAYRRE